MRKCIDLSGRRFGRLLVLFKTDKRDGSHVMWRCQCDCGNVADVSARDLLHRGTVSCGCNRREKSIQNLDGDRAVKLGQVEHTNASRLVSDKPQVNNRSGFRGVSWSKNGHGGGGKWLAVIYFQGKQYRLGYYATPQAASEAYKAAKNRIHGEFLDWYYATYKRKEMGEKHGKQDDHAE